MLFKIMHTSALISVAVLVLGCTTWAQSIGGDAVNLGIDSTTHTLTITVDGKLGPILSGWDPLGLDGKTGRITVLASESLWPTKHNSTSATYILPAGAIEVRPGDEKFSTKSPSKMIISLTKTADILTLIVPGPKGLVITATTFLEAGSWTAAVLKHPGVFTHSPQKLTAAKTDSGRGCKVKFAIDGFTTVLGFSGTAWDRTTEDPALSDDDLGQDDVDQ